MKQRRIVALAIGGFALPSLLAACGSDGGAAAVKTSGYGQETAASSENEAAGSKSAADLGVDLSDPDAFEVRESSCAGGVDLGVIIGGPGEGEICVGAGTVDGDREADGTGVSVVFGRVEQQAGAWRIDRCVVEAAPQRADYATLVDDNGGAMLVGITTAGVKTVAIEEERNGEPLVASVFSLPEVAGISFYAASLPADWRPALVHQFDAKGDSVRLEGITQIEGCWE